ncbi:hypothetical protein L1D52_23995 [Vibrio brasiliensis]|uniref:hypothetical protein n=1 Tax=Vibrio brasiliensis TaxID=170652 RepID=UPI001EFCA6FC|nr:hypothetical protein [Vibrio brasiliensis]MCG9785374.1 hypothetical protein [Vibrio brasiliensis]
MKEVITLGQLKAAIKDAEQQGANDESLVFCCGEDGMSFRLEGDSVCVDSADFEP